VNRLNGNHSRDVTGAIQIPADIDETLPSDTPADGVEQ
jgi:hypothetical protein